MDMKLSKTLGFSKTIGLDQENNWNNVVEETKDN